MAVGVFWVGVVVTQDDLDDIGELIENYTDHEGKECSDIFSI